jgi:ATP-binding cassette subfamily A (ABC1) protein 3
MTFFDQVRALVRKDVRIFFANRKASTAEALFPILMGIMTGLFILLIQLVQNSFGEYANQEDNTDFWLQNDLPYDKSWIGFVASKYALPLANFLNPFLAVKVFDNVNELTGNYTLNVSAAYNNVIGLDTHNDANNFTIYSAFRESNNMWSLGLTLGSLMTSSNVSYPQTVTRQVSRGKVVVIPNLRAIFSSTGCMFLIYAFIPSLILTGGRLVEEKRVKARESLKVMGLHDSAYVISNFISSILRMAIGTGLISFCLAAFQVIVARDIADVFFIGLMFACSLIAFAQIMPALFSASIWSNVMCIMLLAAGAAISSLSTGWDKNPQTLCCLLSPVAFYYAILPYMAQGTINLLLDTKGATFMLIVDTLLYILIGNYLYAIAPGEFGVPKHPLFFIRWIWTSSTAPVARKKPTDGSPSTSIQQDDGVSSYRIVLDGLFKYFGDQTHTPSVNNLSLCIKRGEIFALLGHNGAGKTTTISILTGMITPSSYVQATVDGNDVSTSMDVIRRSVGLCPQFDVLFNDLTARQHLELFAEIKGLNRQSPRLEELMQALELPDTNQKSSTFSGGTKRRLSVGNALVGDATLIFLDEPSSGMDPLSRRKMWDLLKQERANGKTIVLTTHFMEEADYLGERIAIMSRGKLFCCNTSQQLKETHGVGYYLTFVKGENHQEGSGNKSEEALKLIRRFVPEAHKHHESSGETQFLLPIAALPKFGELLTEVERNTASLGYYSYGLSMNTLEDVFVSISEKEELTKEQEKGVKHQETSQLNVDTVGNEAVEEIFRRAAAVSYRSRLLSQISTVFWRKVLMLRRTRRMQLMLILFPLFFIVTAFLVIQPQQAKDDAEFDGENLPNYMEMNVININLRDKEDNLRIISHFTDLYKESFPNASLTVFTIDSMDDYASGKYLPMKSVSFASGFHTPDIPFGFLAHETNLSAKKIDYTFMVNKKFSAVSMTQFIAMYNTAIERAAGNAVAPLITFRYEPFPSQYTTPQPTIPNQSGDSQETSYNFMQVGIYLVVSVVQLVANCAIPVSDEIQRQVYHANRVQGMTPLAYFVGNLLFDFMSSLFPFVLTVVMIFFKGIGAFYSAITFWVILAGFLFAVHTVLQAYVLITYVDGLKPVTYTGILHGVNLAMLGAPYLIEVVLNAINFPHMDTLKPLILSLTPPASFYHILDNASDLTRSNSHAGYILTFTGKVATAWGFVFLVAELVLPIFFLYAFASGRPVKNILFTKKKNNAAPVNESMPLMTTKERSTVTIGNDSISLEGEDSDVRAERTRVLANPGANMVSVCNLRKVFGHGDTEKVAVKDVSFGLRQGECFGLLGPNGAGKSTTCNLILRHLIPTDGVISFPYANVDTTTPMEDAFSAARIGVCMQGDSLWEFLSAREHMDQYLRLRLTTEYDPAKWQDYITNTIKKVHLEDAKERPAGGYSGGMKRKLLVCLAMYTGALSVFLDEPSTGMDPFSRRALWSVILEALSNSRSVLLTTHSMEEADAVCGRISIISAGRLRCIGTSQHLKNRFGSGYVCVVLHEPDADTKKIDATLKSHFGQAVELQEVLGNQRRYGLGSVASLAAAFKFVESQRETLQLHQYSISQTVSLEQIFLAFVGRHQASEM